MMNMDMDSTFNSFSLIVPVLREVDIAVRPITDTVKLEVSVSFGGRRLTKYLRLVDANQDNHVVSWNAVDDDDDDDDDEGLD